MAVMRMAAICHFSAHIVMLAVILRIREDWIESFLGRVQRGVASVHGAKEKDRCISQPAGCGRERLWPPANGIKWQRSAVVCHSANERLRRRRSHGDWGASPVQGSFSKASSAGVPNWNRTPNS